MSTIIVSISLILVVAFSIHCLKHKGSCGDGCSGCGSKPQGCSKDSHDIYKEYKNHEI